MQMSVALSVNYSSACEQCAIELDPVLRAAIRDSQVGKVILMEGNKHCHPVAKKLGQSGENAAPRSGPIAALPPSGELFAEAAANTTKRPLNGIDPNL